MPFLRRGGNRPEIGELKDLKVSSGSLSEIVERMGRRGWHIADGRHGTDNLRDKFRKSHVTNASEQGGSGGAKSVTPAGSVSVANHTLSTSRIPSHNHSGSAHSTSGPSDYVRSGSTGYLQKLRASSLPTTTTNSVPSQGSGGAHNHGGSFSGSSHTNEPQHVVVLVLQYTGVKVAGVTP